MWYTLDMDTKEPTIGEIRKGKDIGYNGFVSSRSTYIYMPCEECGKKRWVRIDAKSREPRGLTKGKVCKLCAVRKYGANKPGKGHASWNGGRSLTSDGYVNIYLEPDDFFYPMVNESHYVREHRLVIAKHLGRCLHEWEVVHHKGVHFPIDSKENKSDNSLENLQLVTDQRHTQITILENRIAYQNKEIIRLKRQLAKQEKEIV
jgi:uncharacterized small protein (DUF1192 family)